jgi:hypothetical protein
MKKLIPLLALAGVAACGGQAATTHPHPSATSTPTSQQPSTATGQPADPHALFLKTGAKYDSINGKAVSRDVEGDKYLCGYFTVDSFDTGTGERVCVDSYASLQAMKADLQLNADPTDGSQPITDPSKLMTIWLTPTTDSEGNFIFPESLKEVAARVGITYK